MSRRFSALMDHVQLCAEQDFRDLSKPLDSEVTRLEARGAYDRRQSPNRQPTAPRAR